MLNFGIDYDGTITNAPVEFLRFMKDLRANGHKVYIVTMRYPSECANIPDEFKQNVDGLFATSREAKREFMKSKGIDIHIWVDDNPEAVTMSAAQIWGTPSPEGMVIDPVH